MIEHTMLQGAHIDAAALRRWVWQHHFNHMFAP